MNGDIEAIKSRINIVDLIGEKVRLKRAGRNYFGLCPFHNEKSPSFSVSEEIQRYKCFGCGESGDVFSFVMKTENVEFREALEELAEKVNYKLTKSQSSDSKSQAEDVEKLLKVNKLTANYYYKSLINSINPGLEYAKKRGLNKELVRSFGIGYAPDSHDYLLNYLTQNSFTNLELEKYSLAVSRDSKSIDKFRNRLMFSIFDEKGRIVGFAGRFIGIDKGDFKTPKYLNSSETPIFHKSKLLFGLFQAKDAIRKMKFAVICEGQMNVLSSFRVGVENITASLGTSLTDQHLKLIYRYTDNIYFAFDKDTAGKKALLRSIEMGFKNDLNIKVISWDAAKGGDPDELISSDPKLWINAVNNPVDPIEYLFNEFKNKYKIFNSDNTTSLLKLVFKLLKVHSNKVKVEYYLKFLSENLEISLTSIEDLLLRSSDKQPESTVIENSNTKPQDTKKNIFDQIFSLILQSWKNDNSLIFLIDRSCLPEKYKELYDSISLFTDITDLNAIRQELSPEMQEFFDNLMLMNNELDESKPIEEHVSKLIPLSKIAHKKGLIDEWTRNLDDETLLNKINDMLNLKDNI